MRLENSELRAFRAVIEEGGFQAGRLRRLHISQSAVSQAVAGLESPSWVCTLGPCAEARNCRLTDAGTSAVRACCRWFASPASSELLEDIAHLRNRDSTETLNLALSGSINRF